MRTTALAVVGLSLAACVSTGKYDSVVQTLRACQSKAEACTTERDAAQKQAGELQHQLATVTTERDEARAGRGQLQGSLGATQKELEQLRERNAEAEKRAAAFKDLSARLQKMISSGKITVGFRNGLMIVKLPAGILFASGKADLSEDGQVTITEVGEAIRNLPDRHFLIAGHTDNVPLKRGKFKDNWELSTARALVVTRWLMQQGVPSRMVAPAGYGDTDPVADNSTEEGRQENRRIEIVLMPNIQELPAAPDVTPGG